MIIIIISDWEQSLRYRLSDGAGNSSAKQVDVRFQNKDVRVVWGGAAQQLWEMFQAEALQGPVGEEGETCRSQVVG